MFNCKARRMVGGLKAIGEVKAGAGMETLVAGNGRRSLEKLSEEGKLQRLGK